MRLTEDDREKLKAANFSTAYFDLVDDPDDWPGMIAYCQHKEDIIERCQNLTGDKRSIRQKLLAHKNLTSGQIQMLKTVASLRVEAYAQEAVDAAKPSIERDALATRIDQLSNTVGGLLARLTTGRIRRFFAATSGSLVIGVIAGLTTYLLILAVPDVSDWVAARDTGALVRQVENELTQLRAAVEDRLGPLSEPLDAVETAAPTIDGQSEMGDAGNSIPGVSNPVQPETEPIVDDDQIATIWNEAAVQGADNEQQGFRKDICGAWIRSDAYNDRHSVYGWVAAAILHNFPDPNARLHPYHWQNAPVADEGWICRVKSRGTENVLATPSSDHDKHPSSP